MGSIIQLDQEKIVLVLEQARHKTNKHQAEDNIIDFFLWTNNSATFGKTKSTTEIKFKR